MQRSGSADVRSGRRQNPSWWWSAAIVVLLAVAAVSIRALTVAIPPSEVGTSAGEVSASGSPVTVDATAPARAPASVLASPAVLAAPAPTATDPPASVVVRVGNTDGQGAYLHSTASLGSKLQAYPDGTELRVMGPDVDAEGQHWRHVAAPDGANGYIAADYVVR